MARIKITLPKFFHFAATIAVRITDINFGGHVGNDAILGIIHEARTQFLNHHGYDELNMQGASLIMSDVAIEFKKEIFYGDVLTIAVTTSEFSKVAFDIHYKLEIVSKEYTRVVAIAKTGMICYDYTIKKIMAVPEQARLKLEAGTE